MDKLKPCPFCGKTAHTTVDDETVTKFGVKCFSCGGAIEPEYRELDDAIDAWNRRVAMTALKERQSKEDNAIIRKLEKISGALEVMRYFNSEDTRDALLGVLAFLNEIIEDLEVANNE